MTPGLLEPLRHAILSAQQFPDPALRRLAVSRFRATDRRIHAEPPLVRARIEEELFRLLPSDWPLWVEGTRALRPRRAA